jgi:hypothetical protein
MVTLMRTLKLLLVGVLFMVGTAMTAAAQTPAAAQQPAADAEGKYFFNLSVGGQSREQTFTDTSTFQIYGEQGALATAHSIGGGTLFDVSAGARVWRSLSIGIGYSSLKNKNDAAISVRVPHPIVFGQSRVANAIAENVEHSENAVHLQFMWRIPVTDKFQLTAMAGPSFFTVRQSIATIQAPQDIQDVAPFTNVTITSVRVTEVKDSPVGVHIGIDGTYFITTYNDIGIGIGAFARYVGASFDLPTAAGVTRDDTDLKVGGPQGGIGLRLRF